eukprot:3576097-Rhodomonas_salina.2
MVPETVYALFNIRCSDTIGGEAVGGRQCLKRLSNTGRLRVEVRAGAKHGVRAEARAGAKHGVRLSLA